MNNQMNNQMNNRMNKIMLLICVLLFTFTLGDTEPTGGAICISDNDCGILDAGICDDDIFTNGSGVCVCFKDFAKPDCTYARKNRASGWFMLLCFVGVGGISNFVLERTVVAIIQMCLVFSAIIFAICKGIIKICDDGSDASQAIGGTIILALYCLLSIAYIVGFIWCIVDLVGILNGSINDGNGYATY